MSQYDVPEALPYPRRPLRPALWRGARTLCPACGKGVLFQHYLEVVNRCPVCGEELHHHRADSAPPYFTVFLVAHMVIPLAIVVYKLWRPALWVHFALWIPLALALSLLLLPVVKGGIVALQWALCMHGFEFTARCHPASPMGFETNEVPRPIRGDVNKNRQPHTVPLAPQAVDTTRAIPRI